MKNRRIIPVLALFLVMVLPFAAYAVGNTTLDWGANTFDAGSSGNIPNGLSHIYGTFYLGNVQSERTVSVTVNGNNVTGGNITNLEAFDTDHGLIDATFGTFLRVRQATQAPIADTYTVVIDFGGDVTDVQFVVFNLDSRTGSDRVYRVNVTGSDNAVPVNPQLATVAGTLNIVGQTATSQADGSALGVNVPAGTVVDTITLVFSNADGADSGAAGADGNMQWQVSDIAFSPSTPTAVTMSQNGADANAPIMTAVWVAALLAIVTMGLVVTKRRQDV